MLKEFKRYYLLLEKLVGIVRIVYLKSEFSKINNFFKKSFYYYALSSFCDTIQCCTQGACATWSHLNLKQFFPPLLIAFAQVSPSPCIIALASSGASSLVVVFLIGSELRNKKTQSPYFKIWMYVCRYSALSY